MTVPLFESNQNQTRHATSNDHPTHQDFTSFILHTPFLSSSSRPRLLPETSLSTFLLLLSSSFIMTNQHQHQNHRDGGRTAAVAANSSRRKIYEEPNYDPDWAICPDGGSNNRWDYQRHFPTCQGYKCLYSCDAAWNYYQGLDAPLDFSYELTVKTGVSGSVLTTALLEMEERMLSNMAQAIGIDDCICSTMNGDGRGYRALRAPDSKDASNAVAEKKVKKQPRKMQGSVPEGQEVVNLSNLIKDDILAGKSSPSAYSSVLLTQQLCHPNTKSSLCATHRNIFPYTHHTYQQENAKSHLPMMAKPAFEWLVICASSTQLKSTMTRTAVSATRVP